MSAKNDISIPLEPDCYFHIYNRGNNTNNIFYNEDNYKYFLKKLDFYMSGYFHFFCYCLIPNHFHLLIRVKSESELLLQIKSDFPNLKDLENLKLENLISEKFRRFFLSYSKSINKQQDRTGSLFQKYFRRKKINTDDYFRGLVWYIHNNPVKHDVCEDYKTYQWSSYQRILIDKPSKLNKKEVFEWFGSIDNYITFHESKEIEWNRLNDLILDD